MRTKVTAAIKSAFCTAFPKASFRNDFTVYASKSLTLPCVWLSPIEMIDRTGRKEGKKTYRAEIVVFGRAENMQEQTKAALWESFERAAMSAIDQLYTCGDVEIVNVGNIKSAPEEYAMSGYQAVSLKVSTDITILYCE
ncbi:MAG: hypothetical protein R3Y68_09040 [Rikenellaceae bacterium]